MNDTQSGGRSQWEPETPFLDTYVPFVDTVNRVGGLVSESPFLSEYETAEGEAETLEPMDELLDEILGDLETEQFGDGLQALVDELAIGVQPTNGFEMESTEPMMQAQLFELERAAEALIDRMGEAASTLDPSAASEAEVEQALEAVALDRVPSPAFEQFLGGLKKKLKKLASKAVKLAKKGLSVATTVAGGFLLKPLLQQVKKLVRPLLEKVLKIAMDRIPEQYRPLAKQLAMKLGLTPPAAAPPSLAPATTPSPSEGSAEPVAATPPPGGTPEPDEPAVPSVEPVQTEFDFQLTELLLAPNGTQEEVMGSGPTPAPITARDPLGDLDRARDRFVRELSNLRDGEDPTPVVEQFLPAIMLALRTGIKLIGRPRVVNFLGGLIGTLIGPLVGKNGAALGRMIADLGLKYILQAEVDPEKHTALAAEALASTIEDTVRRAAALPEEVLDDRASFEAMAYEAFEAAAAANLPSDLVKPHRRESGEPVAWIHMPPGRRIYKKHGRVVDIVISPHVAAAVRTFGSGTLSSFFRDRLRLATTIPVAARVHIYEATPHTRLSRIAQLEQVRGLGSGESNVWTQLHPLTPEAAGLLLGAPALGRELGEDADPAVPAVGQRYYFLEIQEAPARPLGAESRIHVIIDFPKDEIRVCIHLSEVVAQSVSAALRKNAPGPSILTDLRAALAAQISALSSERPNRIVRVRFGRRPRPHKAWSAAQRAARRAARSEVARTALDWAWSALSEQLLRMSADFIAKTEGPEDGVIIQAVFRSPPGLRRLRPFLRGIQGGPPDWPKKRPSGASFAILPGTKHG